MNDEVQPMKCPPRSAVHRSSFIVHRSHARAFTLIELMVIIGIIAVLAALLLPTLNRMRIRGRATRMALDLQSVSAALEAFKGDTGDYPRAIPQYGGFAVLGKELVGPYGNGLDDALTKPNSPVLDPQDPPSYNGSTAYKPGDSVRQSANVGAPTFVCLKECTAAALTDQNYWVALDVNDTRDGPGDSIRAGGAPRGPYLSPDRFHTRGAALLDINDNPILYFPRSTGRPNVNVTFQSGGNTLGGYVDRSRQSAYNADDNLTFFLQNTETITNAADANRAMKVIRVLLGDFNEADDTASTNGDGKIDPGEKTAVSAPFVLWCAGPDGVYGPLHNSSANFPAARDVKRCDDVTNVK
jgi:type II secretory pathway pseudopilin PulG